MWSLATLQHLPGARTLIALNSAVARQTDALKPNELANVMWAYATLEAEARGTQRSFQPLLHSQHAESFPLVRRPFNSSLSRPRSLSLNLRLAGWTSGRLRG